MIRMIHRKSFFPGKLIDDLQIVGNTVLTNSFKRVITPGEAMSFLCFKSHIINSMQSVLPLISSNFLLYIL
jgi:hypothetical protein